MISLITRLIIGRSSQRTGSIIRCLVSRHGHDISNPTFLLTSSSAVPLESVTCLGSWPLTLTTQLVTIFCSVYAEPAPGVVLRPPDRPAPAPPPLGQTLQVLSHKLGVTRARESLLIGHWLGYSPLIGQRLAGLWLAIKAVFVLAPIKSFLFLLKSTYWYSCIKGTSLLIVCCSLGVYQKTICCVVSHRMSGDLILISLFNDLDE